MDIAQKIFGAELT